VGSKLINHRKRWRRDQHWICWIF